MYQYAFNFRCLLYILHYMMINYYSSQYLQEGLSYCKIMRYISQTILVKHFAKKNKTF